MAESVSSYFKKKLLLKIFILEQIDGGTKDIMRQAGIVGGENANFNQQIKWLIARAQERRDEMRHSKQNGFMKGMLETLRREAALMKEAKIKILKYPKMDEEVDLLIKWNQERIPNIRNDLPDVLKEVFLKNHHHFRTVLVSRNR